MLANATAPFKPAINLTAPRLESPLACVSFPKFTKLDPHASLILFTAALITVELSVVVLERYDS